jgi:photosystem I reaction center subunit XII
MLYHFINIRNNRNLHMISDTQIFVALILALVSFVLAIRLGTALYQ